MKTHIGSLDLKKAGFFFLVGVLAIAHTQMLCAQAPFVYGVGVNVSDSPSQPSDLHKIRRALRVKLLKPEYHGDIAKLEKSVCMRAVDDVTLEFVEVNGISFYEDEGCGKKLNEFVIPKNGNYKVMYVEKDMATKPEKTFLRFQEWPDKNNRSDDIDVSDYFSSKKIVVLEAKKDEIVANGKDEAEITAYLCDERFGYAAPAAMEMRYQLHTLTGGAHEYRAGILSINQLVFHPNETEISFTVKAENKGMIGITLLYTTATPVGGDDERLVEIRAIKDPWYLLNLPISAATGAATGTLMELALTLNGSEFRGVRVLESALGGLIFFCVNTLIDQLSKQPTEAFQSSSLTKGLTDGFVGGILGGGVADYAGKLLGPTAVP